MVVHEKRQLQKLGTKHITANRFKMQKVNFMPVYFASLNRAILIWIVVILGNQLDILLFHVGNIH